jgi:hypothetical protein
VYAHLDWVPFFQIGGSGLEEDNRNFWGWKHFGKFRIIPTIYEYEWKSINFN